MQYHEWIDRLEDKLTEIYKALEELRASTSRQSQDFPAELALRDLDLDNQTALPISVERQ